MLYFFQFYLLPYQCHHEKENTKSPEKENMKKINGEIPLQMKVDREKKNILLVLNPHIPQLIRFELNISIVHFCFLRE